MKKLLIFFMLISMASWATNEPKLLCIYGPTCLAEFSTGVRYYMAVIGNLNGNPIGRHWECTDLQGNPLNYFQGDIWGWEAFLNIADQPFVLTAWLHYSEHGTHEEKYLHTSYLIRVGTPTFTLTSGTIRNGEWDQDGQKHIYFNIDYDCSDTEQDYLIDDKTRLDDEFLPLRISYSPAYMCVDYVTLRMTMPPHIRLCLKQEVIGNYHYGPFVLQGETTNIYCGASGIKGNIFNRDLYLEGIAIGSGRVKIGLTRAANTNYFNGFGDVHYVSCADIYGNPPDSTERNIINTSIDYSMLKSCEYSIFHDYLIESNTVNRQDYNAPAFAVDPTFSAIGYPFKVEPGYGTINNPFIIDPDMQWRTSYEAFGGAGGFYTSTLWPINLYPTQHLGDSIVLHYEDLKAARRSSDGGGNIPNMFIMKTPPTGVSGSGFLLNHNGRDMLDYYYDDNNNDLPVIYAPILE